jgi:hypothetical protein
LVQHAQYILMALIRRDSGVKATIVQNLSSKFESDFIRVYQLAWR